MGGRRDVIERKLSKKDTEEGEEGMCATMGDDEDGLGREKITERNELKVRTGAKAFVCGDEVGEENVFTVTDDSWLTDRPGSGGREKRDESDGMDGIPKEGGAGAVDRFESFAICGELAPRTVVVVCLEEDLGMFIDAFVTEVESPEAADVVDDVIEEVEIESA